MGQSAAKHSSKNEGSTTSRKAYTQVSGNGEQPEKPLVEDIVSSYMVTYSSSTENDTRVTNLYEGNVMEELFVAPLHYGFVFFGWLALAIAGVLLQVFASFGNLIGNQVMESVDNGMIAK